MYDQGLLYPFFFPFLSPPLISLGMLFLLVWVIGPKLPEDNFSSHWFKHGVLFLALGMTMALPWFLA